MLQQFRLLSRSDRGVAAVDYSLIVAIIAIAGISAMRAIGAKAGGVLNIIATTLS